MNVPTALEPMLRDLDAVRPHPENVRRGDVDRIAASLERFGQLKPIAALPDGRIVAGNHTYLAVQGLGWPQLAVVTVDLTEDEARRYMLADNRSTDVAGYDDEALMRLLSEMMEAGQLDGTGYTPDEVDDLIAAVGEIPVTEAEEFEGDYAESAEATRARWGDPDDHTPMFSIVLLYSRDDAQRYNNAVQLLMRGWGMKDRAATVLAALENQPPAAGVHELETMLDRLRATENVT